MSEILGNIKPTGPEVEIFVSKFQIDELSEMVFKCLHRFKYCSHFNS